MSEKVTRESRPGFRDRKMSGLPGPRSVRIIARSEDNREHCRTIGRIRPALLRQSICATDLQRGIYEGSTGYRLFRLAAALLCCAAPIAAANAADRIAINIDVIGPLGMRVLEMHSLLEREPGTIRGQRRLRDNRARRDGDRSENLRGRAWPACPRFRDPRLVPQPDKAQRGRTQQPGQLFGGRHRSGKLEPPADERRRPRRRRAAPSTI